MIKQSPARQRYEQAYRELRWSEGFPLWITEGGRISKAQDNAYESFLYSHIEPMAWHNRERFNRFRGKQQELGFGRYWLPF